ncbi:C-type lectin 37Db-like [Drosophila innubila]|uniref:C-type lectin 37Db-like n=1 Tax=Drosophila innubila TaxID=198719 RepID=UPI00148B50E7|nr:C-type lectin 37Db-like [Drosophila innubila]
MLWHKFIGFAILSLVLSQLEFVQSDVVASGCKGNFSPVADKCLIAVSNYSTWYDADRHCRSLGAGLLSLQNQTQLLQITEWLNIRMPNTLELWTSGNTLGAKEGTYYWQSTGEEALYLPWSAGPPEPSSGDCLTLYVNGLNNWGSFNYSLGVRTCNTLAALVCEQEVQKYPSGICLKTEAYENIQVLA